MIRHQWVLGFIGNRPPSGPDDAQNLERLLGILAGLDLDARLTIDLVTTVATYVTGAVIREAQEIRGERDRELAEADLTAEELQAERDRYRNWFEASGHYPQIMRFIKAGVDPDDPATRDERFEFGLDCVLDGIAVRLPAGPARPGP
jgi:Tetracyclin repressor-like, C-terminal domain